VIGCESIGMLIDPLTAWNSSMLNAMQFFPSWTSYMDEPTGETLGRLSAMYSIGSIASLPVVPYMSDHFGRRMPIIIGCSIMVAAASIQTAAVNLPMFEGTLSPSCPLLCSSPRSATLSTVPVSRPSTTVSGTWVL
jgi:MFS family permease